MFNSIMHYVLAILLASTLGLGYASYSLTGKLAVARQDVTHWTDMATKAAAETLKASQSCEITIKAIEDNQKVQDALSESRTSDLDALDSIPHLTLPETKVNGTKTPTAAPKTADDSRLSPDLMRLLDNAYCSGNKDDSYCTAR